MTNRDTPHKKEIINSLNDALKGELFPNLRGITVDWDKNTLYFVAYVNGAITESMIEHVDNMETYFLSHMSEYFKTHFEIKRIDFPEKIKCLKTWIYRT